MRNSIEPKDRIYVKGYRLLSFVENMGKNLNKKISKKLLDKAKKSSIHAKKLLQKYCSKKSRSNW